ncbi:hypothetical protein LPW41_09215 [Microbacterium sp. JC 701]|uniref:hypothetical protein n=1 Tax=Microbacterium sp. JC 701 TaxID=2897389 RepID=UPI001E542FDB|nr:hypothetical protein [Microbacterium sp. JC 701]MCD2169883.1 hypothetical protein [Microbacterium sp. JC 701]
MSTATASVLVESFDAYLRRRALSAVALVPGEAVTAAVGLLRGCRAVVGRIAGTTWWLTAEGRPVAIPDEAGGDPIEETASCLERLTDAAGDDDTRGLLVRAHETVLTRPPREWDALERRLFAHATPEPLVLGPLTPAHVAPPSPGVRLDEGESPLTLRLVDADLAEAVRESLAELRTRWRSSPRMRMALIGTATAAVLTVTLAVLLPTGEQQPASATATSVVADSPTPTPTVVLSTAEPTDERLPLIDDVIEGARALFGEIDACQDEPACVAAHEEDSSFPREPLLPMAAAGQISLIDDFGGVAVVSLESADVTQYVTLVRQKDRWLVRAVRTVADQPS